VLDLRDGLGHALRKVGEELAQVAHHRRQGEGKKERHAKSDTGDEDDDGDGARGAPAANIDLPDRLDDRHENHGEEGRDIDDAQLFVQRPGEKDKKDGAEAEEDVGANGGAALGRGFNETLRERGGRRLFRILMGGGN
jgi:hypothetical protein